MKKILYVAMSALMLTSCYEDKGNYDYHFDDLNKVDISDVTYTPSAYEGVSGSVIDPDAYDGKQGAESGSQFKADLG